MEQAPKPWEDERHSHYHKLAFKAEEIGYLLRKPELVEEGRRLADLLQRYPADHDGFYKAINQADALDRKLAEAENERLHEIVKEQEQGPYYAYKLYKKGDDYIISIINYRTEYKPIDIIAQPVRDYLAKELGVSDEPEVTKSEWQGHERIQEVHKGEDGRSLHEHLEFEHEDYTGRAYHDQYYFHDMGEALKAWNQVKKLIETMRPKLQAYIDRRDRFKKAA